MSLGHHLNTIQKMSLSSSVKHSLMCITLQPLRKRELLFPPEPAQLQYSEEYTVMKCHSKSGYYVELLELPGSIGFIM